MNFELFLLSEDFRTIQIDKALMEGADWHSAHYPAFLLLFHASQSLPQTATWNQEFRQGSECQD